MDMYFKLNVAVHNSGPNPTNEIVVSGYFNTVSKPSPDNPGSAIDGVQVVLSIQTGKDKNTLKAKEYSRTSDANGYVEVNLGKPQGQSETVVARLTSASKLGFTLAEGQDTLATGTFIK